MASPSPPNPSVGEINIGTVAKAPFVRLPDITQLFERRARRLATLASGNPLAEYLGFIAELVRAQASAANNLPAGTLPGADHIKFCHEHKLPLIDRLTWKRDPSWQAALAAICSLLETASVPVPARLALEELDRLDGSAIDLLADEVLGIAPSRGDAALSCFVTAALQVHWTRMAALLDASAVRAVDPVNACPVCGSAPIASVVHAEGSLSGVRFLVCGLCNCEWHSVRIKCAHCQSTQGIAYQHVVETGDAIKAETCDECRTYTKIVYKEKEPAAEPFADDLATVALDILVGEAGWERATPHPFLAPAG